MHDLTISAQERFWNGWNWDSHGLRELSAMNRARAQAVIDWIQRLRISEANILEIGCGDGWFTETLRPYGAVTALDLAGEAIERARARRRQIRFIAGDFLTMRVPADAFDLVVTMETIAHVGDQSEFLERVSHALRPGGHLVMTTQNRFVFERREDVMPQGTGQIRMWLSPREVRTLLRPRFTLLCVETMVPEGHSGILRVVNSPKLNGAAAALIGRRRVDRLKERLGFGQTIVAVAKRR